MNVRLNERQKGASLLTSLIILMFISLVVVLGVKVFPTFMEYRTISKAAQSARTAGSTVREIQLAFDKNLSVSDIDVISSKDIDVTKSGGEVEINFSYQKRVPIWKQVSLLIEYTGTTTK